MSVCPSPLKSAKTRPSTSVDRGSLSVVQELVPFQTTDHLPPRRPKTSVRPLPSKSPKPRSSTTYCEVLRCCHGLVPPYETFHSAPVAWNTSVRPSPSKSPNRSFESATPEVLRWI